ncbi:MAG: hypothetical protein U0736_10890 [Gemmataceae bacterium]
MLTVEAAVPAPATSRPLVWAALAAVAVVLLVLFLDQAPPSGLPVAFQPTRPDPAEGTGAGRVTPPSPRPAEDKGPAPAPPADATETARYVAPAEPTVKHLRQWLQENQAAPRIELLLAGDLDLSRTDDGSPGGLLLRAAEKVTVRPRDTGGRVTLRFSYDLQPPRDPLVALTVQSRESSIEGVRFLVNAHQAPGTAMTALHLKGGKHQVTGCEFLQAQPSLRSDGRLASVLVDAARGQADATLRDCVFLGYGKLTPGREGAGELLSGADSGGQDAVVRRGMARVLAQNCVFGPHVAAFRLEGSVTEAAGQVSVRGCTVLLGAARSAAFEFPRGGAGRLEVADSVFARCPGEPEEGGAYLLRQADDRADAVTFQGSDNRYHDLDGYWLLGDDWQKAGWGDFRRRLADATTKDDTSRVLLANPWTADPADQLGRLDLDPQRADPTRLAQVFALQPRQAAVRKLGRSATELVGATAVLGAPTAPAPLPPLDEKAEPPLRRQLVVEEREDDDSANGVYRGLDLAVRAARPGDVILIRHTGELKIDPIPLSKKEQGELTIRPARRFQPIVTLAETSEADAALFRVHDGQLRLEGLEFRLPGRSPSRLQTVVALVGNGECVLRDCVVTLQRAGDRVLAVATLGEPGKVMKLDMPTLRSASQGPRLALESCLVRGDGDVVISRVNRPFALDLKESMVLLSGSLVGLEPPLDDRMAGPPQQRVRLGLDQCTTYLAGPLVRIAVAKDARGLLPVVCKVSNTLLVPAGAGRPLIQLTCDDAEERAGLRDKLTWTGSANAYGGYTSLTNLDSSDGVGSSMGMEKWKLLAGEENSTFGVKLLELPPVARFAELGPADLRSPAGLRAGVGTSRLPRGSRAGE